MELTQLKYFQKAAQLKSLTKAAQELYISQPTLSQSLARLETSIGCPLFTRRVGKPLELNDAGILFLERVNRVFEELEDGVNAVRQFNDKASTQISIASSIHDLCNELVLGFFDRTPNIHISQRLVQINSLTELLLDNEIDFAISPCPLSDPQLDCRPLYTEELLALVGPGHRLYGRRQVGRAELLGERFILNYSEADRNYLEDMLFENEQAEFDVMLESNEPSTIRRLVDSGAGVAFVPARIIMRRFEENPDVLNGAMRIQDYRFDTPTCISKKCSRYLLQAAAEFYDFVVEFCRKESDLASRFLRQYFS